MITKPGWVELDDPNEIWSSQISCAAYRRDFREIAFGITNQHETTIIGIEKQSKPLYNAMVWQDRRTAKYCDKLNRGLHRNDSKKTGLVCWNTCYLDEIKMDLDNIRRPAAEKKL
jgi:glycerol kinase